MTEDAKRSQRDRLAVRIGGLLLEKDAGATVAWEMGIHPNLLIVTRVPVTAELRVTILKDPATDEDLETMAQEIAESFARIRRAAMGQRAI